MKKDQASKKVYYVKKDESMDPNSSSETKIKVLIAGFPPDTTKQKADLCMEAISEDKEYSLILRNKKKFRGFAFILFQNKEEADEFLEKEHKFENTILDCRFADLLIIGS